MIQKLKTAFQFTKHVFTTGAFYETSRKVELEICKHLTTDKDIVVVEFGMGHGNITSEILASISPNSKLYSFEINTAFCKHVKETINDNRLIIINDSAEHVKNHVTSNVDNVIASIPFSFFSEEKKEAIIQNAFDVLKKDSYYSQVLYTKFNFKKFEEIFTVCEIKKLPHIPTEYIYHCRK